MLTAVRRSHHHALGKARRRQLLAVVPLCKKSLIPQQKKGWVSAVPPATSSRGFLVENLGSQRGDVAALARQRQRALTTPGALPRSKRRVGIAGAVAGALALSSSLLGGDEQDCGNEDDAKFVSVKRGEAAIKVLASWLPLALLITPPPGAACAYRRRIQDMYRIVDNPVGQGWWGYLSTAE